MNYASKSTFCLNNLKILSLKLRKSYKFALSSFVNSHTDTLKIHSYYRYDEDIMKLNKRF